MVYNLKNDVSSIVNIVIHINFLQKKMKTKILVKNRNSEMTPIMKQDLKKFLCRIQLNTIHLFQDQCTGLYKLFFFNLKINFCLFRNPNK